MGPGKDLAPQIYEFYRNKICFGDYKPGDKLPSYKSLAEKYAGSYSPIKTAYQSLEREGYIHLSTKGSIVFLQPISVKEIIASLLVEIVQTARVCGASKEDIVEAIDFIMEKYC